MRFETSTTPISTDKEILIIEKITVSVVDEGVELFIKSPIFHAWAKSRATIDRGPKEFWPSMLLPAEWDWPMRVSTDSFDPSNLFWILSRTLDLGFTHVFKTPVLVPAELCDYIQATCDNASKAYTRFIVRPTVSGSLRAHL